MLKNFIPELQVDTIYQINLQQLKESGVKGIITDLDNTLVGAKEPNTNPQLIEWLKLVDSLGFQLVIVSNNSKLRVAAFSDAIQLPYIPRAQKPLNKSFHKALEMMNLHADRVVVIGDQLLTDVLGGNRMGLYTILVTPFSLKDESFFTRINRRIERYICRKMKQRGWITWDR
ncbi:MAG: YqeG family HAD IIIA-type phosphatase [Paenibacillaceae bacterium]